MLITSTWLTDAATTVLDTAKTTHTGTKIIDYLIVTNVHTAAITVNVDLGHATQRSLISGVVIPKGVSLKVVDSPIEITDSYEVRVTQGDAAHRSVIHLAIKYPPINNIKK